MQYNEVLEKIAKMGPELRTGKLAGPGGVRKFSLDHIRVLLERLGHPQRQFAGILIAGTNGKGSTSATLAAIAAAAGLRTGLYTSPHVLRINERIQTANGGSLQQIPDADFARVFTYVDDTATALVAEGLLPHTASFFELLTTSAFVFFAERQTQLAVIEVGLGGITDATNVVDPILSVITDIGLDHMEHLGNTVGEIAAKKAGILREAGVLVTLAQHPEANAAIGERAVALGVRGVDAARFLPPRGFAGEPDTATGSPLSRNRYDVSFEGEVLHLDSPLAGQYQQRNLALAVAAAVELRTNHGFAISNQAIEQGVRSTVWPGRLEWLPSRRHHAPILLDVAHNPAGAWALRAAIAQIPESTPRTLIFSCLADKQIDEMAQVLLPLFDNTSGDPERRRDHVILAPVQNPRAATVEELLEAAHKLGVPAHAAPHVHAALAQAEAVTPPDGIIVVTGSIFLVSELRAFAVAEGM